jgi:hypothetical protein
MIKLGYYLSHMFYNSTPGSVSSIKATSASVTTVVG